MKVIIAVAFLAFASATSPPATHEPTIPILRQDADVSFDGTYQHSFETAHGINVQEQGVVKNAGSKDQASEVTGSFEYTSDDGTKYTVQYIANENGYQPQGDHLPVAPAIPSYIQRSLDWIAAHPQQDEKVLAKKF